MLAQVRFTLHRPALPSAEERLLDELGNDRGQHELDVPLLATSSGRMGMYWPASWSFTGSRPSLTTLPTARPMGTVHRFPADPFQLARMLPESPTLASPNQPSQAGGSWSLVFNSPTVNRAVNGVDPRAFPEYARNDASLTYRNDGPVLAGSEWPQRERPDLAYARRVYLDPRADQLLFFDYESRYRAVGGYRSVPVSPGDGLWGFWR